MTTALRWILVALLTGHGLLHLLGALKGFGWADVTRLEAPISVVTGVLWLATAALVLVTATVLALGAPAWWWILALGAATLSQVAVVTSWSDARAGSVVNVVLVLAAGYSFAATGPSSFRAEYDEQVRVALADVAPSSSLLAEADLVDLPGPLAAYVRRSGAVGRPRVVSIRAEFHGRIRSGADAAWMPFTGEQVNTFGPRPQRVFLMDATRSGLPVTVLHEFANSKATMRAKVLSLVTVVDAAGGEMDRGETVTVFNDLVLMAPGAIADAPIIWTAMDTLHVRGDFTDGDQTVSAVLTFDADHELVDFTSDDRFRASPDGTSFERLRWSTPLAGHRSSGGRRVMSSGEGVWHAAEPEGTFTYLEYGLDTLTDNVGAQAGSAGPAGPEVPVLGPSG